MTGNSEASALLIPLCYTDAALLDEPVQIADEPLLINGAFHRLSSAARSQLVSYGIKKKMPIVLKRDGSYNHLINGFLRSLPDNGCNSPLSWEAYARDLMLFETFLIGQGCEEIGEALPHHFRAYRALRRHRTPGQKPVEATTWDRQSSTLRQFFSWRSREKKTVNPYEPAKKARRPYAFYGDRRRGEGNTASSSRLVKHIRLEDFRDFVNLGLCGSSDDNSTPEKLRMYLRNAAFAQLAVCTGLRLTENAALLLAELGNFNETTSKVIPFEPGVMTTKGQKHRRLFIPTSVLKGPIEKYCSLLRSNIVTSDVAMRHYSDNKYNWQHAALCGDRYFIDRASKQRHEYHKLDVDQRKRLLDVSDGKYEPAMLWLQENGQPAANTTFSAAFERANRLLETRYGKALGVSPHMLRHTFAVYTLTGLIRRLTGTSKDLEKEKHKSSSSAYQELIGDPLRTLQRWLGHSSIDTTMIYLTYIDQNQDEIEHDFANWNRHIDQIWSMVK